MSSSVEILHASLSCICSLFDEDCSNIEHTASVDRAIVSMSFVCQ